MSFVSHCHRFLVDKQLVGFPNKAGGLTLIEGFGRIKKLLPSVIEHNQYIGDMI